MHHYQFTVDGATLDVAYMLYGGEPYIEAMTIGGTDVFMLLDQRIRDAAWSEISAHELQAALERRDDARIDAAEAGRVA